MSKPSLGTPAMVLVTLLGGCGQSSDSAGPASGGGSAQSTPAMPAANQPAARPQPGSSPGEQRFALSGEGPPIVARPRDVSPAVGSGGSTLEARQQALTTSESTVLQASFVRMAESASSAFQASDGVWKTLTFANLLNDTGPANTGSWNYGCILNSTTQCNMSLSQANLKSDPSTMAGGGFVYASMLTTPSSHVQVIRSNSACCGGATWNSCTVTVGADFPMAVFADASSYWYLSTDFAVGLNAVSMVKLTWCSSVASIPLNSQCPSSETKRNAHGVMGGNGLVHVVYVNDSMNRVEYIQFNGNTNTWNCSSVRNLGNIHRPNGNCMGSTSRKVYPNLGNSNIEYSIAPRIVRDPTSGTLVAAWDSFDQGPNMVRSRALRSTDGGNSWTWPFLSPAETAHSVVASSHTHRIELGNTYNGSGNQGAQVSWKSTDAGATWSGTYISNFRNLAPVMTSAASRPCHWGDYESVTWHPANDAFFHTWVDTNQGPHAVIRGRFITR